MKFCFWGNVAEAFKGNTSGGGELQIALLAKALAKAGHEVVVIDPFSDSGFQSEEGVAILPVAGWNKGIRGLRMITHRLPAFYRLLRDQKADVYYIRLRSYLHIPAYLAARKNNAKFIQALAHDLDVQGHAGKLKNEYLDRFQFFKYLSVSLPNDLAFDWLLKRSDYVFLQHSGQKVRFQKIKGKEVLFRNLIVLPSAPHSKEITDEYYIHVGAISVLKGSENLFELIRKLSAGIKVVIVGNARDKRSRAIVEKLRGYPNVILTGRKSHSETLQLISRSKALISTSNFEGFPNIFLESWVSSVPVISLHINPDRIIEKYGLGYDCAGDINRMIEVMEKADFQKFRKEDFYSYLINNHNWDTASERLMNIIS